jgi:hypothetical protein
MASTAKLMVAMPASSETVGDGGAQQSSIRSEIDPEIFFGGVVDDFVDEVRPEERFAAGGRQHTARSGVQPIDSALGGVFTHAAHAIVVGPAVVAIEIAFPLGEEVGNDGLKFSGKNSGFEIGCHPAAHSFEDAIRGLVALASVDDGVVRGDVVRVEIVHEFGMLREDWLGERDRALRKRRERLAGGVLKEFVERDVQAEGLRGNGGERNVLRYELRYRPGCRHGCCGHYRSPSARIMTNASLWVLGCASRQSVTTFW